MTTARPARTAASAAIQAPQRAGLVLTSLIVVAAVANLNLSVANVALPSIGKAFDSLLSALVPVAVGYSPGPAPPAHGWAGLLQSSPGPRSAPATGAR